MSDTRDVTRVLFEWECPCPPERAEAESNDGGRERRRSAEFKHDARRCPERTCTVLVIRLDVPYVPDLRRPVQGALDIPGHPAPEVPARPLAPGDPELPRAVRTFQTKATKHGWATVVHYARGTPLNLRVPRVVDSFRVTANSPDDGSAVVALWVDGKFDLAYGCEEGKARKLSAAQAGAWLTGGRPDDGGSDATGAG